MRPGESFIGQPIRSLQTMLQVIAENDSSHPALIPDGIYGPETQAAISTFQRKRGLPVTGITNQQTWDEIVRMYDEAMKALSAPQSVNYEVDSEFPFVRGDHSARLKMAQCMLCEIADRYACVCPPERSGKMDEIMINSISEFQNLSGLPMNGILDKETWNQLVLQFAMAEMMKSRRIS